MLANIYIVFMSEDAQSFLFTRVLDRNVMQLQRSRHITSYMSLGRKRDTHQSPF